MKIEYSSLRIIARARYLHDFLGDCNKITKHQIFASLIPDICTFLRVFEQIFLELFLVFITSESTWGRNLVNLGKITSQGARMCVTDIPVLNYGVIYHMCEPQVKVSRVSYQSGRED